VRARVGGGITWWLVAAVALAVAALSVWVWPSPREGTSGPGPEQVDVTGPVGRIGGLTAGGGTGATRASRESERWSAGGYTGRTGTGAISGPIGGLEAVRGVDTDPGRARGGAPAGGSGGR
jgi:hypothetical protein